MSMINVISKIYEIMLEREIKKREIPKHVAIIMDGNRRYARRRGLPAKMGHVFGSKKAEKVLEWCWEIGIKTVTVYAFSTENFKRDEEEKENIFKIIKEELKRLREDKRIHRNKVRVRVVGRRELLPNNIIKEIKLTENATKSYANFFLNIAIAYGGRQEIVDAIRGILIDIKNGKLNVDEIDEEVVGRYLYSDNGYENVDLLIRTGGEQRISNFLPWQSVYSHIYFCDILWPAFRKIDLLRAIRAWQFRIKNFNGKWM